MVTCPLKPIKSKDRLSLWLRGSIRGTGVYKSTHSDDRNAAEAIRIILERQLLENSIFGKRLGVVFDDTAATCLDADRSTHTSESASEVPSESVRFGLSSR